MFTGLVAGIGDIVAVDAIGGGHDARLTIRTPEGLLSGDRPAVIGASIACSGCCLTATSIEANRFTVAVSAETLSLTTIGRWRPGTTINLERSLRLGDELGGHLVSGHIDGVGALREAWPEQGSLRLVFTAPPTLARLIARKGSIAVDGVSLTVNGVGPDGFDVNIIPHTAAVTTLGRLSPGDPVHLEADMLARYVARLLQTDELPGSISGPLRAKSP